MLWKVIAENPHNKKAEVLDDRLTWAEANEIIDQLGGVVYREFGSGLVLCYLDIEESNFQYIKTRDGKSKLICYD